MSLFAAPVASLLVALVGTGLVRRYAIARALLDVPNFRSSHDVATPRGGGLAIVVAVLAPFALTQLFMEVDAARAALLLPLLGILTVAAIGWRDDSGGVGVTARLIVHSAAALTVLPLVLSPTMIPPWLEFALLAGAWWAFCGVSAINVVNFMDGIDGLIAGQILIFGLHMAALTGADGSAGVFGLILAGATLGFLLWNWAPAKIFMGDVGSGALGLSIVFGGALVMRQAGIGFIAAFLPLYPLFLDAFVTLVRRAIRGERLTQAHRSHLYQRLANRGWGHARVSVLYGFCAALGMVVAQTSATPAWPVTLALYAVFIIAAGIVLDSRVPLPA